MANKLDRKVDLCAGIERAVAAAGGVNALTRSVNRTPGVVSQWRKAGRIPAEMVQAVARATGLAPEDLRPDLFSSPRRSGLAEAQDPFAAEARALGLDAEAIAAQAVQDAVRAEKARRWQEENREAIESHNAWVEKHGVPLAKYRMF